MSIKGFNDLEKAPIPQHGPVGKGRRLGENTPNEDPKGDKVSRLIRKTLQQQPTTPPPSAQGELSDKTELLPCSAAQAEPSEPPVREQPSKGQPTDKLESLKRLQSLILSAQAESLDQRKPLPLSAQAKAEPKAEPSKPPAEPHECPLSGAPISPGEAIDIDGTLCNIHFFTIALVNFHTSANHIPCNPFNRTELTKETLSKICAYYGITLEEFSRIFQPGSFPNRLANKINDQIMWAINNCTRNHIEQIKYVEQYQEHIVPIQHWSRTRTLLFLIGRNSSKRLVVYCHRLISLLGAISFNLESKTISLTFTGDLYLAALTIAISLSGASVSIKTAYQRR